MQRIVRFFRNVMFRERVEHELDDELSGAMDWLIDEKRRAGMTEQAARREARLELGSPESIKDAVRDVRTGAVVESVLQDIRYGLRLLARNPLFTVTAGGRLVSIQGDCLQHLGQAAYVKGLLS